jgi:hypothetical protein
VRERGGGGGGGGGGPYSRLNLRVDTISQQPRNLVVCEKERERNSVSAILRDEVRQKEVH